jgi:hypothetical protein
MLLAKGYGMANEKDADQNNTDWHAIVREKLRNMRGVTGVPFPSLPVPTDRSTDFTQRGRDIRGVTGLPFPMSPIAPTDANQKVPLVVLADGDVGRLFREMPVPSMMAAFTAVIRAPNAGEQKSGLVRLAPGELTTGKPQVKQVLHPDKPKR